MLVLFSGGRGSGKSTIARALYSALDSANYNYIHQSKWKLKSNSFNKKVLWILYILTFFRYHVCNVFYKRLFRDLCSRRTKGGFGRFYMPCVFSYHVERLKKNKEHCVIYESDFLTWAADKVIDDVFNPLEVKNYYLSVVLPRVNRLLVVVCDTPIEKAFDRWRLRENKKLSKNEIKKWCEKRMIWKQAREEIINTISEIPDVKILHLDGLDTPKQNSSIILDFLLKIT